VLSSERRKPTPPSLTAITTTRRPRRRRKVYACTATQPLVPACSTIFWHASESAIVKRSVALSSRPSSPCRIRVAPSEIFPTTSCTSSVARTGVTSSSTSDGPVAGGRGTLPWSSNSSAAWWKKPARAQYRLTSSFCGTVKSGLSRLASARAWPAVSMPINPYGDAHCAARASMSSFSSGGQLPNPAAN